MIIYTHPIADNNLPIKTLVARQLQTNSHTQSHTRSLSHSDTHTHIRTHTHTHTHTTHTCSYTHTPHTCTHTSHMLIYIHTLRTLAHTHPPPTYIHPPRTLAHTPPPPPTHIHTRSLQLLVVYVEKRQEPKMTNQKTSPMPPLPTVSLSWLPWTSRIGVHLRRVDRDLYSHG